MIVYDPTDPLEVALYKVWFTFIKDKLPNENVFLMDSNFIAPDGPYTVIKFTDTEPVSWAAGSHSPPTDNTNEIQTYINWLGFLSIYVYGQYAMSRAQTMVSALRFKQSRAILNENGVGTSNNSRVRNASRSIDETQIEERAHFSIQFNFVQTDADLVPGTIDTVNSVGDLEEPDGEIVQINPSASYTV